MTHVALQPELICGLEEASCVCGLEPDHEGPHECKCTGSWTFDEAGRFVCVSLPDPSWSDNPPLSTLKGKEEV